MRYEIKYNLDPAGRTEIKRWLATKPFVRRAYPDRRVCSLYLDTLDFTAATHNLDGIGVPFCCADTLNGFVGGVGQGLDFLAVLIVGLLVSLCERYPRVSNNSNAARCANITQCEFYTVSSRYHFAT